MAKVACPITINIPRQQAWEYLQDITIAHEYVPGITRTEMNTEQKTGVGASRRVFNKMGGMDETVTEWQEGYGFKIRLHDGEKAKPFPDAFFTYQLEDGPNNTTTFTAILEYRLPGGVIGQWIDKLCLSFIVKLQIRKVAEAVKNYYEGRAAKKPS